jgi:hypothetical protein
LQGHYITKRGEEAKEEVKEEGGVMSTSAGVRHSSQSSNFGC